MLKINYMSTLFVGIDVSSKTNAVYAMDFEENKYLSSPFDNNQPGADKLVNMITECMHKHKNLDTLLIVLESTSVYSVHISNFLSTSEVLMPYNKWGAVHYSRPCYFLAASFAVWLRTSPTP